jgi:glycosyltransferase involved in cell wall biosynthesis
MRIAFVVTQYSNPRASGVLKQAINWQHSLESQGATVELVNPWRPIKWKEEFDLVHIFSGAFWATHLVEDLVKQNIPIVHSPILDTTKNRLIYRMMSYAPMFGHMLYTMPATQKRYGHLFRLTFARSLDEFAILSQGIGVRRSRIKFVPIAMQPPTDTLEAVNISHLQGKDWCLHVSQYTQERKNVVRLAKACAQLGLKLVICGDAGGQSAKHEFLKNIQNCDYTILDYVTPNQLSWLYNKCSVFALPSLYEGVGLVALEAAYTGCPIVASTVGGTRDYLQEHAFYANPHSIADIALTLKEALKVGRKNNIADHVRLNYTPFAVGNKLLNAYSEVISI